MVKNFDVLLEADMRNMSAAIYVEQHQFVETKRRCWDHVNHVQVKLHGF